MPGIRNPIRGRYKKVCPISYSWNLSGKIALACASFFIFVADMGMLCEIFAIGRMEPIPGAILISLFGLAFSRMPASRALLVFLGLLPIFICIKIGQ